MSHTLVRYWGSYLKSPAAAEAMGRLYQPFGTAGWRTFVVMSQAPSDPRWLEPLAASSIEPVFRPRPSGQFDWSCIVQARDLCRSVGADAFHCDNIHTSPIIGAALARVPVRLWLKQSMDPYYEQMRRPTLRERLAFSTRVTAGLATRVLAVSAAVKDGLVARGIPASKITVFPNYRETATGSARPPADVRSELGIAQNAFLILTVGHSVRVKGWNILLDAFRSVAAEAPAAYLLFVGSTSAPQERVVYEQLAARIQGNGLSERVGFVGHSTDVASLLGAADAYVLPSLSEGHSLALLEALAAGLPCVATRVGAADEAIRDGDNGFLVERNDTAALAQAILQLAREPALRSRFARRSRRYLNVPSPEEYGERLLSLCAPTAAATDRAAGAPSPAA